MVSEIALARGFNRESRTRITVRVSRKLLNSAPDVSMRRGFVLSATAAFGERPDFGKSILRKVSFGPLLLGSPPRGAAA
jgi:hypothetical protein